MSLTVHGGSSWSTARCVARHKRDIPRRRVVVARPCMSSQAGEVAGTAELTGLAVLHLGHEHCSKQSIMAGREEEGMRPQLSRQPAGGVQARASSLSIRAHDLPQACRHRGHGDLGSTIEREKQASEEGLGAWPKNTDGAPTLYHHHSSSLHV